MCRAPEAPGPARAVPVRTLVQLYAACFVEVALVACQEAPQRLGLGFRV